MAKLSFESYRRCLSVDTVEERRRRREMILSEQSREQPWNESYFTA